MRISNINSYKPNFGKVSSNAIDAIRQYVEGYGIDFSQNGIKETYNLDPQYNLFNASQLKTMQELVNRASILNKSIITKSDFGGLCVRSKKVSPQFKNFDFWPAQEGNRDFALQVFRRAVEYAEKIERGVENKFLFKRGLYMNKGAVSPSLRKVVDRFRSKENNELMQSIYDKTITIGSEKPAPKRKKSAII